LGVPESAKVYFYGAGCINKSVNETVRAPLIRFFNCSELLVDTDLMAVARSLCQDKEGIACILGTGSNSCYYDGSRIVRNISPLGYMLGDEGSGAVIGKKFIADLLKNQLPASVAEKFFTAYDLKPSQIMDHVYKKPFPNRFLAGFTRFIHDHPEESSLRDLVKSSFIEFYTRNIRQYPEALRLPVNFIGSVGFYFEGLLREAASETGYSVGQIILSPMEGLIQYHLHHNS
jgi:N-acetylglucosamine kinase-like BadF-type ATPase